MTSTATETSNAVRIGQRNGLLERENVDDRKKPSGIKRAIFSNICFPCPWEVWLHSGNRCVTLLNVGTRENSVIKRTQKRLMTTAIICLLLLSVLLASLILLPRGCMFPSLKCRQFSHKHDHHHRGCRHGSSCYTRYHPQEGA